MLFRRSRRLPSARPLGFGDADDVHGSQPDRAESMLVVGGDAWIEDIDPRAICSGNLSVCTDALVSAISRDSPSGTVLVSS